MTADNIIEKGRRIVESGKYAPGFSDTAPNGDEPPLPPEPPDDGEPPPDDGGSSDATGWLSDANISKLLVNRVLRGKYCWAIGLGWMRWDDRKWVRTATEDVIEQSRLFATKLVVDAVARRADPDKIRAYTRRLSSGAVRAAADLAKGQLLVDASAFDKRPDLLNVANGVVDLRTGVLGKHDPALLLTKCAPTDYVADATHPDWTKALKALPADVAKWMQLRLGQGITGYMTSDDKLPVLHGGGENGKTTITVGVTTTLGEHATIVPDRVLLSSPGDHPTELMTLRGARLALLEETPEARHLNVKRLKDVLGTPMMSARLIRHDNVSWAATHSLFVSSNYEPRVEETDHGTWRRLALVKFPYTYRKAGEKLTGPNDRRDDPTLRDRIMAGRDGRHEAILKWLVDGARRWYQDGRVIAPPPATVTNDTREWRRKSDLILRWFDDTLVAEITEAKADRGCGYCIPGKDMYEAFAQWLDAEGHRKWSAQTFVDRFGQHDEIVSQRIVHDRVRLSTTKLRVDRKPSPFSLYNPPNPLPERFRAWLHVRFRTEDDDRAEGSEQGKQDIGTYGTDGLGERPIKPLTRDKPEQASRTSQDGAADDSATKFKPPTGSGRCLQCGWHSSTQGHAPSCPSKEEARR